jgi:hypothetical protein
LLGERVARYVSHWKSCFLLPISSLQVRKLYVSLYESQESYSASDIALGELLGKRVARQVTVLVARRASNYVEPPSDKTSPSQPGNDRNIERREHISCANVGIHGSGMKFLCGPGHYLVGCVLQRIDVRVEWIGVTSVNIDDA